MTTTIGPISLAPTTAAIIPRGARPIAQDDYDFTEKMPGMPEVGAYGNVISARDTASWFTDSGDNLSVVAINYAGKSYNLPSSSAATFDADIGKFTILPNGDYKFIPSSSLLNSLGSSSSELDFSYTIRDSSGQTSSAQLHISVLNPDKFYEQFVYVDSKDNQLPEVDNSHLLAIEQADLDHQDNDAEQNDISHQGATGFFAFAEHSALMPNTTQTQGKSSSNKPSLSALVDESVANPPDVITAATNNIIASTTPPAPGASGDGKIEIAPLDLLHRADGATGGVAGATSDENGTDNAVAEILKLSSAEVPEVPGETTALSFVLDDNTTTSSASATTTNPPRAEIEANGFSAQSENYESPVVTTTLNFDTEDEAILTTPDYSDENTTLAATTTLSQADYQTGENSPLPDVPTTPLVTSTLIYSEQNRESSPMPERASSTQATTSEAFESWLPRPTLAQGLPDGFESWRITTAQASRIPLVMDEITTANPEANSEQNQTTSTYRVRGGLRILPTTLEQTTLINTTTLEHTTFVNTTTIPLVRGGIATANTDANSEQNQTTSTYRVRGDLRILPTTLEQTTLINTTTTNVMNSTTQMVRSSRGGIRGPLTSEAGTTLYDNAHGGATGFTSAVNTSTLAITTSIFAVTTTVPPSTTIANTGKPSGRRTSLVPEDLPTTTLTTTTSTTVQPTTTKRPVNVNDVASNNDEAAISYESDSRGRTEMDGISAHGNVLANDTNSMINFNNNQLEVSLVNGNQVYGNSITIQGKYGELVMNKNGSYAYEATSQPDIMRATEVFTYTVLNKQTGMRATATLTVTIADHSLKDSSGETSVVSHNDQVVISDGHGINTYSDSAASSVLANDPSAVLVVGVGNGEINQKIIGNYGNLVMDEFGHYAYTPNGRNIQSSVVDHFTYQVKFADGQTLEQTLSITIKAPEVIRNHQEILGDDGNNIIYADQNNYSTLIGGAGSDTLYSVGVKTNTFKWRSEDLVEGLVDQDTIYGFKNGSLSDGSLLYVDGKTDSNAGRQMGDQLDFRDLLNLSLVNSPNATQASVLKNYLHFEQKGNDTIIHVDKDGAIRNDGGSDDLRIVLKGVDLTHHGSGQSLSDQTIIEELLQKNKLIID